MSFRVFITLLMVVIKKLIMIKFQNLGFSYNKLHDLKKIKIHTHYMNLW